MKKFYRWVVTLLMFMLVGTSLSPVVSAQDFSGKTLTIGVWGGNDAEEAGLQELIDQFEEQTGAKVEKKVYTDYNTQIQTDMIGGTAPDTFYVDSSMLPFFVEQGTLMPLDPELMEADEFFDTLIDTYMHEGELYAIPKDFSTLAFYVNTDIFEDAGLSIDDIPESWEDFEEWLPEAQEKIDEAYGEGKVFVLSYNDELPRNLHIAERGGAELVKDDYANFTDPDVLDNLSIYPKLVETGGYVTPADVGAGWNGEAFGTGKIAIMDEGNWVYQELKDNYPDINFTVLELPLYKDEKGSMMFSVGWGKYAGTEESELVDAWIQWVTGAEGMGIWSGKTGTLPARGDVSEELNVDDHEDLGKHIAAWEYATAWQKGVTLDTIGSAYENYISQANDGTKTLEEAMQEAQDQANADIDASH